jgi:monothiol glutaredoxin
VNLEHVFEPCSGVKYGSRNVLADSNIRDGIKQYTEWPTIPQVGLQILKRGPIKFSVLLTQRGWVLEFMICYLSTQVYLYV